MRALAERHTRCTNYWKQGPRRFLQRAPPLSAAVSAKPPRDVQGHSTTLPRTSRLESTVVTIQSTRRDLVFHIRSNEPQNMHAGRTARFGPVLLLTAQP